MNTPNFTPRDLTKLAKACSVKLPRVGYEVCLVSGVWLASTGHFQFGWFGSNETKPYRVWGAAKVQR